MNLVIDIGNTSTKTGCFQQDEMIFSGVFESFSAQDAAECIQQYAIKKCILSSVKNHPVALTSFLQSHVRMFIQLSHTTPLPFRNQYQTPETLGRDRLAAIAGAHNMYPGKNVLVIDMGTAITFDLITGDTGYLGGNISPGMNTRFRALHTFTSKLPLVENEEIPSGLGRDTRSAILAGVQHGIVHEINGYAEYFNHHYSDLMIILTGGDADFFVNKLKKPIFAVPNLVLQGLNYILEYNAQKA